MGKIEITDIIELLNDARVLLESPHGAKEVHDMRVRIIEMTDKLKEID